MQDGAATLQILMDGQGFQPALHPWPANSVGEPLSSLPGSGAPQAAAATNGLGRMLACSTRNGDQNHGTVGNGEGSCQHPALASTLCIDTMLDGDLEPLGQVRVTSRAPQLQCAAVQLIAQIVDSLERWCAFR